MRTPEEVVERIKEEQQKFLSFQPSVLAMYLPFNLLKQVLKQVAKKDADLADWAPLPLTRERILFDMGQYMAFAWEKAINHRGLSAGRSVDKMRAWLWLLGEENDLVSFVNSDDNYPNYGAPILKRICEAFDLPLPEKDYELEMATRMAQGLPCEDGCKEGCGR